MDSVLSHTDTDIPDSLKKADIAKAFYGIINEHLHVKFSDLIIGKQISASSALIIDDIIRNLIKVNWQNEVDIPKKMIHQIGDYLIDEVRDKHKVELSFEEIDSIAERCVDVAKIRYKK